MENDAIIEGELPGNTIDIVPYDPAWPMLFRQQSVVIRQALGPAVLAIDHTGSTAVPGLAAKPIIDILVTVADSSQEAAYVPQLELAGFRLLVREPGWFQHRMLRHNSPLTNLHVFTAGCPEIERVIIFRDWLRLHNSDLALYEAAKRKLSASRWASIQDYADAKTEVISEIMQRALTNPRCLND